MSMNPFTTPAPPVLIGKRSSIVHIRNLAEIEVIVTSCERDNSVAASVGPRLVALLAAEKCPARRDEAYIAYRSCQVDLRAKCRPLMWLSQLLSHNKRQFKSPAL
eukprot:g1926.t1